MSIDTASEFRLTRAVRQASRISCGAARLLIALCNSRYRRRGAFSPEHVATALYQGILDRAPDICGFADKINLLRSGQELEQVIRTFIASPEFRSRFTQTLLPPAPMPDLRNSIPEKYETQLVRGAPMTVFIARADADIALKESLIDRCRFYDRFGVWSPVIDYDKEITAAIVRGLGAHSCFALGCFTGPVVGLL